MQTALQQLQQHRAGAQTGVLLATLCFLLCLAHPLLLLLPLLQGMFKEMARQWKEKGNVSGRFYWPEAGVEFGTNCHPSIYINNAQRQSKPGTRLLPIDVIDSWAISRVDEEFRGSCYTLYADVPGLS
jgi:hypothetical protein